MKRIVILGSTGSIGTQALEIIESYRHEFQVVGLSAWGNVDLLAKQIMAFQVPDVTVSTPEKADTLRSILALSHYHQPIEIKVGCDGLNELSSLIDSDVVLVGVVGFAGLMPTLDALKAGKTVLTANKETFVTAGHLVQPYLSQIIPLDSEHSALFQCLRGCQSMDKEVRKLYLTASGGPFRNYSPDQLEKVSVSEALRHPNWSMGDKVTIDSATMMNKGLEVIEALHLFQLPLNRIEVVVHPQSIVHSAVAYEDGSIIAQMGQPDMRVPIQYGLTYPERWPAVSHAIHLDLSRLQDLQFYPSDVDRFPCLRLAYWAAEKLGTLPVVLNAADELAVQAFLNEEISFVDIPKQIESLMSRHLDDWAEQPDLETILQVDAWTRQAFTQDKHAALSL